MDDEEEVIPEDDEPEYYRKEGDAYVPVSLYELQGRKGEFTSQAGRISARAAYMAKYALTCLARGSVDKKGVSLGITLKASASACKEILAMFDQQQKEKQLKGKDKKIDLGFGA